MQRAPGGLGACVWGYLLLQSTELNSDWGGQGQGNAMLFRVGLSARVCAKVCVPRSVCQGLCVKVRV